MQITSFERAGVTRTWKGHDWDVLDRLHKNGWISNPASKAKSVVLTDLGRERATALFTELLGAQAGQGEARHASGTCQCGCDEPAGTASFRPGHDQKLRVALESRVGGLLSLRDLLDALEEFALGRSTQEQVLQAVRNGFDSPSND